MNSPAIYNLGDAAIAAAVTGQVITSGVDEQGVAQAFIGRLEGMLSATLQLNFTYGAGGTNLRAMVETTLDDGLTWIEILRALFTTASKEILVNLSALTPKATLVVPASLSDDTALDGILGNRMRVKITSTGIYTGNTSLSARLNAR
jgi:hypothetical protein